MCCDVCCGAVYYVNVKGEAQTGGSRFSYFMWKCEGGAVALLWFSNLRVRQEALKLPAVIAVREWWAAHMTWCCCSAQCCDPNARKASTSSSSSSSSAHQNASPHKAKLQLTPTAQGSHTPEHKAAAPLTPQQLSSPAQAHTAAAVTPQSGSVSVDVQAPAPAATTHCSVCQKVVPATAAFRCPMWYPLLSSSVRCCYTPAALRVLSCTLMCCVVCAQ
jgi:hypothetical protein